jgi:hypothetical protein
MRMEIALRLLVSGSRTVLPDASGMCGKRGRYFVIRFCYSVAVSDYTYLIDGSVARWRDN